MFLWERKVKKEKKEKGKRNKNKMSLIISCLVTRVLKKLEYMIVLQFVSLC